jgi:AmmeMemoRadiSam system protein B
MLNPSARMVPIAMADYRPEVCRDLGNAIAGALKERDLAVKTTLIASTDMSHYVPADYARKTDKLALDAVTKLDPEGLLSTVSEHDISMCGSGPTAAVLWAARELGAKTAQLLTYATSGDVTGETDQVVGYAGVIVY